MKQTVAHIYEQIAEWFDEERTKSLVEREYLTLALRMASGSRTVLDLGCGSGEPIARFFIESGYRVTGVDASPRMIAFCRERFPGGIWIEGDMRQIDLPQRFGIVLAWDSFFHLDSQAQRGMFPTFRKHIEPGGVLVFNSGDKAGEVYGDMNGRRVYHSSLDSSEYEDLLTRHGFEVLVNGVEDPDCGGRTVWAARYDGLGNTRNEPQL